MQHHGIKFKESSLRLKLAIVGDTTMLLGREFHIFMRIFIHHRNGKNIYTYTHIPRIQKNNNIIT